MITWMRRLASMRVLQAALIVMAVAITYSSTIKSPLTFYDESFLRDNPAIQSWHDLAEAAAGHLKSASPGLADRIVPMATFTFNYTLRGEAPEGYHAVNILIHIAAALALYWLVLMLFRASAGRYDELESDASVAAFWAAALFAVHPLQTEAVTFVSQRFTEMAALFYLLALAFYVRSRTEEARGRSLALFAASALCVLLAVRSMENAFTLPAAMVLIEACFLGGLRGIRPMRLLAWIALAMLIPLTLAAQHGLSGAAAAAGQHHVTHWDYFLTQQRVLLTYMRLTVLPVSQNIDYDYPLYTSLLQWQAVVSLMVNLGLIALAVRLYRRDEGRGYRRWAVFGILWFYLTLSVESSAVVLGSLISEHRMYLPLAGLFAAGAGGMVSYLRRGGKGTGALAVMALVTVCVIFGVMTFERNKLWGDDVALWRDAASKSPLKAHTHYSLGNVLLEHEQKADAAAEFQKTVELDPDHALAHYNLGLIYTEEPGKEEAAVSNLREVVRLDPKNYNAYVYLGNTLLMQGKAGSAIAAYSKGIEISPSSEGYTLLGKLYLSVKKDPALAAENFGKAVELDRGNYDAVSGLKEAKRQLSEGR